MMRLVRSLPFQVVYQRHKYGGNAVLGWGFWCMRAACNRWSSLTWKRAFWCVYKAVPAASAYSIKLRQKAIMELQVAAALRLWLFLP
jgi:hypothetical protein